MRPSLSTAPWPSCLDVHLHSFLPNHPHLPPHRPSLIVAASASCSSSSAFSSSSPPASPPSTSNPLSLSTLSTPTGSPTSAGRLPFSPPFSPVSAILPLRPWDGRMFSAQWKAVPVRFLLVHAFTLWESVNLVFSAERLQMESLYGRRVVLSLRFDELTRCTRDLSKAHKGRRARVLIANADRQWTLDLFVEVDAIAFYDLLTRALATVAATRRRQLQSRSGDSAEAAGQSLSGEEDAPLQSMGETNGSLSEASDAEDGGAAAVDSHLEHAKAVAQLHLRILSFVTDAVRSRVEEGDALSTLLQLFLAVSPFEREPFDSALLDYRRPLPFSSTFAPSPSLPSPPVEASSRRCADDPCELAAVSESMFCVRHCWRDEVTIAPSDEDDYDALNELRFGFPTANLLAQQILHVELELRDALHAVLEEFLRPLLQPQSMHEAEQTSLTRDDLRSIFEPFVRCHALSVKLSRDVQRLSTHSALLPFLCRTLLHHLPDIRAVYSASFRFSDSIERLRSRMDRRSSDSDGGLTLRQWWEQRKTRWTAQADVLEMLRLPLSHMASYLRLLKAVEAQLPAKEQTALNDDSPLAPPRMRRFHRELDDCWQELLAISRTSEAAARRETERRRMKELSDRLLSLPFPLIAEGRRFIREDEVRLQGSEDGHLLLFSDLLIFALPEGSRRATTAPASRVASPFIRDGLGTSMSRCVVAFYWLTSELRVTWWPSQAEAADGYLRSVTLHTASVQLDVFFVDGAVKDEEDRRHRAGATRDRWCAAWRQRMAAPAREAASTAVIGMAQRCLDQRRLSSADFVHVIQPGLKLLCEEAIRDLLRPSPPASLPSPPSLTEGPSSLGLCSALTAVAVTGLRLHGNPAAQTAALQALTVIALLVEAATRSDGGKRVRDVPAPEEVRPGRSLDDGDDEASSHRLIVHRLAPLLSPSPNGAAVADALLLIVFLMWCNRTSAIDHLLSPSRSCPAALHCLSCQSVCNDALGSCQGEMECGRLLRVLLHVASFASLKSRAWLWQRLSDVTCHDPSGAIGLLHPMWTTWPSLVLASMGGVRRPQCRCGRTKYSERVWRSVSQVVDSLLLTLLLYWPPSAFSLHWEAMRRVVGLESDQGSSHCHLVLQHFLTCLLRRIQHHPRTQPLMKPTAVAPRASTHRQLEEEKGEAERLQVGERAAQCRLLSAVDLLFCAILSFVVTAGSRFSQASPASSRPRPSLSSNLHAHDHWLQRAPETQTNTKGPSAALRTVSTPTVLRASARGSLPHPTSHLSSARAHLSRRRSQSELLPAFPLLRVDDEVARSEQRMVGRRSEEVVDVPSLLADLVQQRPALRLRWLCRMGEDGGVAAWHLADAPLLAHLQATFASHPTFHPISDLWAKLVPDLEQLRWNRRRLSEADWAEVEQRHLCALLLAHSAEQRRQADNGVQTDIRGLAGKRMSDWFGDMPRLHLPATAAAQSHT